MNTALANLVVGLMVAAALVQACRRYLPVAWRRQLRAALVARGWLAPLAELEQASGCGTGCASCNGCAPSAPTADAPEAKGQRIIPIATRR